MNNLNLVVESPGRINLIGEHVDYNGGFVLPAAIDKKIILSFKKNDSSKCNISTLKYNKSFQLDLSHPINRSDVHWENYIIGVIKNIMNLKQGKLQGFDCVIESNLPVGAGISSSSALICGIAKGINELYNLDLSDYDLIFLAKDVEHNFIGLKGGIMDQFTICKAKKNKLLLLNCTSLDYRYIDANFYPYKILLLNSNVPHKLSDSEYNTRVKECNNAFDVISKKYFKYDFLAEIPEKIIYEFKDELNDKIYNRALYVSQENQRTIKSAELISKGLYNDFGRLMYDSHEGLKNLYEVSCDELDFMVDFSKEHKEILGSRLMGGGFGGCTINLILESFIDEYINKISDEYYKKYSINLESIIGSISDGICVV